MAETHLKKCLMTSAIKEMQVKMTFRFQFIPIRIAKVENPSDSSGGFMVLLSAPVIGQWGTVSAWSTLIGWWAEQSPLITSSSGEAVDHLLQSCWGGRRSLTALGAAQLPSGTVSHE